jgi:3-oxoacyl-[acyl-carrier protein] reductase
MGGPDNIRVNAIRPQLIVNKQGHHWLEGLREHLQILKGQLQGVDVAKMILFLCSEDARYVTGETMEVGGGFMYKLQ